MKRLTISVDDETYRRAQLKAAARNTSVSALVRQFLTEIGRDKSETERLKSEEMLLRDRIVAFRAGDRTDRIFAHERGD